MKNIIYLILGCSVLTLVQCKDDEIFQEVETSTVQGAKISGTVMYDTDGDGIGDEPAENVRVFYGDLDSMFISQCCDTMNINSDIIWTDTDADGNYQFCDLPPANDKRLFTGSPGMDSTPDGDENTGTSYLIGVSLEEDEHDSDNNFVEVRHSTLISGYVLEDLDDDLMGDTPYQNAKIDLVQVGSLPYSSFSDALVLATVFSDENGYFEIPNQHPSDYYLRIKEDGFNCEKTFDSSPDDTKDVERLNIVYLPVNLTTSEMDTDNNFIVNTSNDACEQDNIMVRAINISQECNVPVWRMGVYDGSTRINPSFDDMEFYSFLWRRSDNHTFVNLTSAPVSASDTLMLSLMLPNGCQYEFEYIPGC